MVGQSNNSDSNCQLLMRPRKIHKPILLMLLCGGCLLMTGCVQRRMIIRSQPEGAFVTIDRKPIGLSPVSVPYVYPGTRDIQLEKDGYQTIKVQQRFDPKWYQRFPISFFSENFSPREIRDERVLDFQLEPRMQVQEDQLLGRASELRMNVGRGTVTPPIR